MKKILDMLFIKNEKLDRDLFRALFYSFDNDCFAGFDKEILFKHQIYDSYKILKERISKIAENHNEYKYFIELDNFTGNIIDRLKSFLKSIQSWK